MKPDLLGSKDAFAFVAVEKRYVLGEPLNLRVPAVIDAATGRTIREAWAVAVFKSQGTDETMEMGWMELQTAITVMNGIFDERYEEYDQKIRMLSSLGINIDLSRDEFLQRKAILRLALTNVRSAESDLRADYL